MFSVVFYLENIFLSTLSLRRATAHHCDAKGKSGISIHALLAESDGSGAFSVDGAAYFYPRSPCRERRLDGRFKL